MRIGIVSDTHNRLPNVAKIVSLFNAAGVERVVHTGDVTQAKTLGALAGLDAPLFGVYGNNDLERESLEAAADALDMHWIDPPLRLEWARRRIVVVHDPLDLGGGLVDGCDVALHGHDHRLRVERSHGTLFVNPGECAGHMPGLNAIAVLDLERLEVEILNF